MITGQQRACTFNCCRGLMFQASYVFSKSADNGGTAFSATNTDLLTWARSPFDRRHKVVLSFSYDLPEIKLRHSRGLLSGWRVSGIIEFRSGLPLEIYQNGDPTLTQSDPSTLGLPDLVGPFKRVDPLKNQTMFASGIRETGHFFFDPSAFSVVSPADYTQARSGNLPRMAFDGPGFNMWSISVAKSYRIAQSRQVMVRADIRNLWNHANFDTPNVQADSPGSFG